MERGAEKLLRGGEDILDAVCARVNQVRTAVRSRLHVSPRLRLRLRLRLATCKACSYPPREAVSPAEPAAAFHTHVSPRDRRAAPPLPLTSPETGAIPPPVRGGFRPPSGHWSTVHLTM